MAAGLASSKAFSRSMKTTTAAELLMVASTSIMHSVVPTLSVYAYILGCSGPDLFFSLLRTILSAVFSRQLRRDIGLGF